MRAHSEILLSKCAQFREQSEFIDVSLKVGEEVFLAHRIELAASSDYFHATVCSWNERVEPGRDRAQR